MQVVHETNTMAYIIGFFVSSIQQCTTHPMAFRRIFITRPEIISDFKTIHYSFCFSLVIAFRSISLYFFFFLSLFFSLALYFLIQIYASFIICLKLIMPLSSSFSHRVFCLLKKACFIRKLRYSCLKYGRFSGACYRPKIGIKLCYNI